VADTRRSRACYRLVAHYGWIDLIFNHISARVPGENGNFLINAFGLMYPEIKASNLVKIDIEGNVIDDPLGWGINPGRLCRAQRGSPRAPRRLLRHSRPTPAPAIAVSAQEQGLLPINQQAMWFYNRIGYHDYEGVALELDERERLQKNLGKYNALILRNHGLLTLGNAVRARSAECTTSRMPAARR